MPMLFVFSVLLPLTPATSDISDSRTVSTSFFADFTLGVEWKISSNPMVAKLFRLSQSRRTGFLRIYWIFSSFIWIVVSLFGCFIRLCFNAFRFFNLSNLFLSCNSYFFTRMCVALSLTRLVNTTSYPTAWTKLTCLTLNIGELIFFILVYSCKTYL